MSWFWRGFQSAVFYYVSCAPCTKLAYRRKRRKENHRANAERAAIETEEGLYRHPSPFSTNIYWREEMMLGPGPPPKKANRDRDKKTDSTRELRSGGVGSSTNTGTSSADTVIGDGGGVEVDLERRSDEGWNCRRYQREDEILWGLDGSDDNSSNRMPGRSRKGSTHYVARNPAVNDLHPPVVSTQPTHRCETRWMLQPPPSAKIMSGQEKANRNRSGSSSTSGSGKRVADRSLGRKVGERLMEEKVKRGDHLPTSTSASTRSRGLSRESATSETPAGQPHDRQPRASNDSTPPHDDPSKQDPLSPSATISSDQLPRKPPPATLSPLTPPLSRTPSSTSRPLPLRPPLSSVVSTSSQKPRPANIKPLILSTPSSSSLRALQAADESQINTKYVTDAKGIHRSVSPLAEARVKLHEAGEQEEKELRVPVVETSFPVEEFRFPAREDGGSV